MALGQTIRPAGERALLVDLHGLDEVLAVHAAITGSAGDPRWREVAELVPAATTLLVLASSRAAVPGLRLALADLLTAYRFGDDTVAAVATRRPARRVEIPVRYDGPDLEEVAELTGLSVPQVIEAHTGRPWRCAFGGFAPGFSYLVGGDSRLEVPRRSQPRTAVPAGAVALASTFSAVYPRRSPGGWQLIGRTTLPMWQVDRDPPALVQPGDEVRFVAVAELPEDPTAADRPDRLPSAVPDRAIEVLATGPQLLVQDLGRPGYAAMGVPGGGAADRQSLRLANRLLGNPEDAAGLEILLGGTELRAHADLTVVVTGAPAPVRVNGVPAAFAAPVRLSTGDVLGVGRCGQGLRSYLAVAGGVTTVPVLGSRSTDILSGLGPDPLRPGDVLPVGEAPERRPVVDFAPVSSPPEVLEVDVIPGPREEWLADLRELASTSWTVSSRSDRVGVRLEGTPLRRAARFEDAELPSEGVVRGSIQVPNGGLPVVFLADHPVTGGYPVVGVLPEAATDRIAQARPGQTLRFHLQESR